MPSIRPLRATHHHALRGLTADCCPKCEGDGVEPAEPHKRCSRCQGKGMLPIAKSVTHSRVTAPEKE
jgi:DnaJ-class molecular chaperone